MKENKISKSKIINRSQQDIWDYITTPENWKIWCGADDVEDDLIDVIPDWQAGGILSFASGEKGEIQECVPPALLRLRWGGGGCTYIELSALNPSSTKIEFGFLAEGFRARVVMLWPYFRSMYLDSAEDILNRLSRLLENQVVQANEEQETNLESPNRDAAYATSAPSTWRIEPAGNDKQALVESGDLSNENLRSFSVYRLVHPPSERLARAGTITLHGFLTCACGYEIPLNAAIGFKGFFDFYSKQNVNCPQCWRGNRLVGVTTQVDSLESNWLLVEATTGKPGAVEMPGTASGLPELQIDRIEKIAREPAVPSETAEDEQTIGGQPVEPIEHRPVKVRRALTAGDVLVMAIVYEGYVVEEPDALKIAQELLAKFSEGGILEGVSLHPHSAIRIGRADEGAMYRGGYEPGDELPQMLVEGISDLRERLLSEGQDLGKVQTRAVHLKGRSRVVSTCWIAMHILR